jgi:glycosyltransferase involved in cell wall biosynthesis
MALARLTLLLNIAMLTWEYPPRIVGGIARHCYGLANALAKRGFNVHVYTVEFPGAPYEEFTENLHVHRVRMELGHPNFVTWVFLMNHFIEKRLAMDGVGRFDIIHVHDWLTSFAGIAAKHFGRKPLVVTMHSTESKRSSGLNTSDAALVDGIEWWATYEARSIIAVSESMKREIIDHFRLPPEKVYAIPNGVDPNGFSMNIDRGKVKMMLGLSPFDRLVLFIGRLTEQKGIPFLIKAFPKILEVNTNARLVIVGEGPMLESLKGLVEATGISSFTRFLGHVDDGLLRAVLRSADVLVVPSIYEPFGIVALEGMAAGVPVVASDVDGLGEIIRHEVNGIKAYPADPTSIAWGVNRILNDESLARRLVEGGKKLIKERYTWDVIAQRTQKVYEDALR